MSVSGESEHTVYRMMSSPKKWMQETYIRKLSDEMKEEALAVYHNEEVSYSLTDVKYAHLWFISITMLEAFNNHCVVKIEGSRKMSFKSFCALKPDDIRTIQQTPLRGCECEYCQNLGIVWEKLIGLGMKNIPKNHTCSVEVTWCPFRKQTIQVMNNVNSQMVKLSKPLNVILEGVEESDKNCDENCDSKVLCDENPQSCDENHIENCDENSGGIGAPPCCDENWWKGPMWWKF